MKSQICKHCGQQFVWETFFDRLGNLFIPIMIVLVAIHALDCFFGGGFRWIFGSLYSLSVTGLVMGRVEKYQKKKGNPVTRDRECPSCGDSSVNVDSPLGRLLMVKWQSERMVDFQNIDSGRLLTHSPAGSNGEVLIDK
jgi:hypothetical protein